MVTTLKCSNCKIETEDLEKGLCELCSEEKNVYENLTQKLRTHIKDLDTTKDILQTVDKLTYLAKERQWIQCKSAVMKTMMNEKLHQKTAWRLFVCVEGIKGQAQHLEEWEKDTILLLRNELKFSLNTIAFILGRSKETIHRQVGIAEK